MKTDWHGHKIEVRGDWPARWLFLAPDYELWIDGDRIDRTGGPRLRPTLGAQIERPDDEPVFVRADILSIAGLRPRCRLQAGDQLVDEGRVRVRNVLNPFLAIFILLATAVMLYLGPDVIRAYWPL